MSAIITHNHRIYMAKQFINATANSGDDLYMFIGKATPWSTDPYPVDPKDSTYVAKNVWDNMLAMKKVTQNSMELVVPNIPWQSNTVYTAYTDHNTNLYDGNTNFYVFTSNSEVFKCISNNNGALSTVSPLGLGTSSNNYIQTTPDGYQWKYMLDIEDNDQFVSNFWIPIPQLATINSNQQLIQNSAVNGSIDYINVVNPGINYSNTQTSYIVNIIGDGIDANAYAVVNNGNIQRIVMANRGSGYSYANVVFGGVGSGAIATAIMSPPGGHGANAPIELGAGSVMISTFTDQDESGYFTVNSPFRQDGLILNPTIFNSNTQSSNNLVKTATTFSVSGGIGSYTGGETVYQGTNINNSTFSAIVIDFNSTTGILRLNNVVGSPVLQSILYGQSSGSQRYPTNIINPDVQKYSGQIIYLDNEIPVFRTPAQTEHFQYILQF